MKKTSETVKADMRSQYECVCNRYIAELLRMWELDDCYGYWIGEDVGGIYDYDGAFTITMEDVMYCVEHDVAESEYLKWEDYCVDALEFEFSTPNLKSWMNGYPRIPQETFMRLRELKADLAKAVEEEKERLKNGGF